MSTVKIEIEGRLANAKSCSVEVMVELADGRRRWCYFMLPETLATVGDWVPDTEVRFHYDSPNMIVVSEISEEIVRRVIDDLAQRGLLERCTLPYPEIEPDDEPDPLA